jgi:putative ABC transport system substrate-binding protein
MPVVGELIPLSPPANLGDLVRGPIHQGMTEMGFVEGQNLMWEYRWAEGHYDRLPALAADLVSRKVDLIVAVTTSSALAAKNATSTIPIVFYDVSDPVGVGLVASLARPGGNLTGCSNLVGDLLPKQIELLCELVPHADVIALLMNPTNKGWTEPVVSTVREAAHAKGLQLSIMRASTEDEIDTAFATIAQLHVGGLVVGGDPFFYSRREQIAGLATRHAVPAISWYPGFVAAGGLISYGPNLDTFYRQAGIYAGRILKGTNPADLPVQQPTTFKLVINLKTAKALGLTIPPSILARADDVIE